MRDAYARKSQGAYDCGKSREISGNLGKSLWVIRSSGIRRLFFSFICTTMQTRSSSKSTNNSSGDENHPPQSSHPPQNSHPTPVRRGRANAHWNPREVTELIAFLSENTAEKTSGNSFKDSVFTRAADKIQDFLTKGPKKDSDSCKTKWRSVCVLYMCVTCTVS